MADEAYHRQSKTLSANSADSERRLIEMTEKKPHGGARKGAGRKAEDGAKSTTKVLIPLEEAQRAKLKWLGGAAWVRKQINDAPDQGPKSGNS